MLGRGYSRKPPADYCSSCVTQCVSHVPAHRLECGRARWPSSAAASAQPGHVAWTRTQELPGAFALSFSLSSVASESGLERNKHKNIHKKKPRGMTRFKDVTKSVSVYYSTKQCAILFLQCKRYLRGGLKSAISISIFLL